MKYNWHLMRFIAYSFPISKAHSGLQIKGQHTGAQLPRHLKEGLYRLELTDGGLLAITIDNASSNQSMTCDLQTTLEASRIECPA